jgi:hypothetical protein
MHGDTDNHSTAPATTSRETSAVASLTDVIDQFRRKAFQRALDRRPDADEYRRRIEAAHLVRHSSS